MRKLLTLFIILFASLANSQTTISGIVTDIRGESIPGANIYIKDSYDGVSSNIKGEFSFSTTETGTQILIASFLGYKNTELVSDVSKMENLTIILKEQINSLKAVVITAGSYVADPESSVSVLKPLDIVTTAGSAGNIIAAFETLPGTQKVGESGKLFVRGGEDNETAIYIDGLKVMKPYNATIPSVPTRSRFSPFIFKGTNFSTGGYSAEYGQALSSVLEMNTIDTPDQNKTEISVMTIGLSAGKTIKKERNSFTALLSYTNLAPYMAITPNRLNWKKAPEELSGELFYHQKIGNSTSLKSYFNYSYSNSATIVDDVDNNELLYDLKNHTLFSTTTIASQVSDNWLIKGGVSFMKDSYKVAINSDLVDRPQSSVSARFSNLITINEALSINTGLEYNLLKFDEDYYTKISNTHYKSNFQNGITSFYTEANYYLSNNFVIKPGIRISHNSINSEINIMPRLSLAYKVSDNSQFSLAYGDYYQSAKETFVKYNNNLKNEKANHYIINYQFQENDRLFRIEGYWKEYNSLVTYTQSRPFYYENIANDGDGFARGVDVFWRDNKSIDNLEYWVSYSFLDTERLYHNFPTSATPNFASAHNFSVVSKYFINELKSQVGFSYSFASARPYNNPNKIEFMNEKSKSYNNFSVNWAYLISQQTILYASVSNVFGFENSYGYRYSINPDSSGNFRGVELLPNSDRFFFVGLFITFSDDKKSNNLDQL